jgi:hypothetical protein
MVAFYGQLEQAKAATKCCQQRDDKGFTRDFPNTGDQFDNVITTPVIGDLNGDGTLFPDFPKMFVVPDKATNNWSNPVITDLFGDGHREVAFTLFFNRLNDPSNFSRIIVTDLNVCSPETDEDWVTFHKNNQRTGVTP